MAGYDPVHVAVAAPVVPDAGLENRVAVIINKAPYETRLLLAGRIPRIVTHSQTIQAAESIARSLEALEIVAIVCRDSELRKHSSGFRAHTLRLGEGEVLFRDRGGEERRIKRGDVFLLINGRMQTYTQKEVTSTRMKFSPRATLLMGGIPIWRRAKETTRGRSVQTDYFIRLYGRGAPVPSVQILQHAFDYSFLGAEMDLSSHANFSTAVARLRDMFPQAIFDDRLTALFGVDIPSTTPEDSIEINCNLLYLYHRAVGKTCSSA